MFEEIHGQQLEVDIPHLRLNGDGEAFVMILALGWKASSVLAYGHIYLDLIVSFL